MSGVGKSSGVSEVTDHPVGRYKGISGDLMSAFLRLPACLTASGGGINKATATCRRRTDGKGMADQRAQPITAAPHSLQQGNLGDVHKPDRAGPSRGRSEPVLSQAPALSQAIGHNEPQQIDHPSAMLAPMGESREGVDRGGLGNLDGGISGFSA
jgi:hypothetical protein